MLARQIAADGGIRSGPICAFTAVELCSSYAVPGDGTTQKLRLESANGECLFLYHCWMR